MYLKTLKTGEAFAMKKLITLLLLILFTLPVFSAVPNIIVEHYTVKQGLPNDIVNCAFKDSDGFMWFGTWYGLCSFDGDKFKAYNNREGVSSDIPPRKIQNILEDRNGFLWIKTIDHKLYLFNKWKETYHAVYDDMKNYSENAQIIKIQATPEGDVLMLTKNKNLLCGSTDENGEITIKLLYDSRADVNPYDLRLKHNAFNENKEYINWIGTDYKIISFRKGKELQNKPEDFILTKISNGTKVNFTSAYSDNKSMLWIGDSEGRFFSIDSETGEVKKYELDNVKGGIHNLLVTADGTAYLCVEGQGIYEYNMNRQTLQKLSLTLIPGKVTDIFRDSYDKIWFAESERSIVYYDPLNKSSKQFPLSANSGLGGSFEMQDAGERGLLFLTPVGDILFFDREELTMVRMNELSQFSNEEPKQVFFNLFFDEDGILWLTSSGAGVYRINFPKKQFRFFNPELFREYSKTAEPGVKALLQTKNGDIWVGTRSQDVYRLDKNGQLKQFFSGAKYNIGNVYHIMEDDKGNLWFSTKGSGLVKAGHDASSPSGYRFTRFTYNDRIPSSISGNDVYFTYQDSKKRIWVGLFGGGLNLLSEDNGQTTFIHKYNGLIQYPPYGLYMEVRNIAEDNDGRIWVGTMDGLMSFDSNFKTPAEIKFETYRKQSTSQNTADNDIYVLYKDASSQIWVGVFGGGLNKLISYNKEKHLPEFKAYGVKEGLNNDVIRSITEDNSGNLWFATESGLSYFDKKAELFRNYNKYDGFPGIQIEENTVLRTLNGELWLGCKEGILAFSPQKLETYNSDYETYIVDLKVSNRELRSFDPPIVNGSIKYAENVTLAHNQSMFTLEFAALNFYNQNRISYKYILEGYEKEWHFNGKNRIASYTNVPPGEYVFKVHGVDEANPDYVSERTLQITILPPWWKSWWAYTIYAILIVALLIVAVKLSLFMIKMKNDIYIEQKLSELKIRFFTNISHELRTPLTLIKGPIQELKEKEQLSDKGKQYLNLMEKNTEQMLQLVNQILDFRKIQNGKLRLHVSQIDLNKLIEGFHKEFMVMSQETEINFLFHLADDKIKVWIDKEQLEIVIRNILSNAFKFTPAGGRILVSTGISDDGTRCFIRIKDSGAGIPQDKLGEIFERFSQGETKNAYYQGTGIGLALSKEIINLHHGTIYAESEEGKGAEFVIELLLGKEHYKPSEVDYYVSDSDTVQDMEPAEKVEEETVAEPVEEEIDSSLPSLLLVEDNKDLCNMLKLQLDDRFNVYTANDGAEGLKKVHLYHPDIVVTDQMMPEMDGMEMLQRIRKDFQISHIPVIILTAKNDDEAKTKAITLGANAYITKPFSKDYLLARIDQLLGERRLFREKVWKQDDEVDDNNYEQYLVKKDVQLLEKIHQVIEENLDNSDFNIDTIASNIGLSRSAFFKKLKSLTGLAPVDLVKEIRLNKSMELIKNTDLSISEIAFAVGFKDSGYYSKCFRKKYNQTPREYMNEYRKS